MDSGQPSPGRHGPGVGNERIDLSDATERDLAERARVDIDAFAELYRHYLPKIHAFAWRRTGNRQAAEDICAATFEAALKGIASFQWRSGGFGAWLYRIAANQVTDHHRREARPTSDRGQQAMAAMQDPYASSGGGGGYPKPAAAASIQQFHRQQERGGGGYASSGRGEGLLPSPPSAGGQNLMSYTTSQRGYDGYGGR